ATRNNTHLSSDNLRRSLRSALADAGLDGKQWHPHQLRVTVGTALAHNAGVGIENAAAVLGHSGTEITRKHYVERLRRAPAVDTAPVQHGGVCTDSAGAVLGHSGTDITRKHYVERLRRAPDVNSVLQTLIEATDEETAA